MSRRACSSLAFSAWVLLEVGAPFAQGQPLGGGSASLPNSAPATPVYSSSPGAPNSPPDYRPPAGYHQHDGFYFRLHIGPGYLDATIRPLEGASQSYSGVGFTFGAALGTVVRPNLALYGEVSGATLTHGSSNGPDFSSGPADLTMLGIGPGVTYLFDTANVYASASLTFTTVTHTLDDGDHFTLAGAGAGLAVGKEWWISSNWGIGLAAQVRLAVTEANDQVLAATGFSLLLSTTYN